MHAQPLARTATAYTFSPSIRGYVSRSLPPQRTHQSIDTTRPLARRISAHTQRTRCATARTSRVSAHARKQRQPRRHPMHHPRAPICPTDLVAIDKARSVWSGQAEVGALEGPDALRRSVGHHELILKLLLQNCTHGHTRTRTRGAAGGGGRHGARRVEARTTRSAPRAHRKECTRTCTHTRKLRHLGGREKVCAWL